MEWTQEHIDRIRHLFPKQRGNIAIDYLRFFQALHYIDKNGCTWRDLPKDFGNWNSIDKAYEGDGFRKKVKQCGMRPVVPPKSNRKKPWKYNKKLYKRKKYYGTQPPVYKGVPKSSCTLRQTRRNIQRIHRLRIYQCLHEKLVKTRPRNKEKIRLMILSLLPSTLPQFPPWFFQSVFRFVRLLNTGSLLSLCHENA